jgi:hypothetical protein
VAQLKPFSVVMYTTNVVAMIYEQYIGFYYNNKKKIINKDPANLNQHFEKGRASVMYSSDIIY